MLGNTLDPAPPVPFPNQPSRSKAYILLYLLLVGLRNLSPWITCPTFLLLSMTTIAFLWSSTDSLRWPSWRPARRVSQQKPLVSSSLSKCGYTLGSHSPLSQIGTTNSLVHFGQVSVRCWIQNLLSPCLSIPKLMAKQRLSIG